MGSTSGLSAAGWGVDALLGEQPREHCSCTMVELGGSISEEAERSISRL